MDGRLLKLKELFSMLVPYFGTNHAKIYTVLLSGEVKTAKHLAQECNIAKNKVYQVLNDLINYGLLCSTNTHPITYYCKKPGKEIDRLVNKKINLLTGLPIQLQKIIDEDETEGEKTYLVRIKGLQTKLVDHKTKAIIKDTYETARLIKSLNGFKKQLEERKPQCQIVTYR